MREYLNEAKTRSMMNSLNEYFDSFAKISRLRVGERQTIETLINEEAMLFGNFLRNEKETWMPRITISI